MARRRPLVLTYHNDIVGEGYANYVAHLYNHTGLKLVLERANRIIITQPNYLASSSYLEKYEDKVEVVPVGVDAEKFRPMNTENEGNTLFFLSVLDRFHEYKGLDYLLQALNTVKEEVPDVKLIVGGEGELLDRYRQVSSSLGLEENVEFVGFIPDDKIVQYYNRCDLFVLPSISAEQEGFGMVLLEAMACGKPVISTDIVGVAKDLKERGAGIIVECRDAKGLAEAILHILQNKDRATKMGAAGRCLVEEKYRWGTVAERVEKVYEELICKMGRR
jgi:Glycosyltransferase